MNVKYEGELSQDINENVNIVSHNIDLQLGFDVGHDIIITGLTYYVICYHHALAFTAYSCYIMGTGFVVNKQVPALLFSAVEYQIMYCLAISAGVYFSNLKSK